MIGRFLKENAEINWVRRVTAKSITGTGVGPMNWFLCSDEASRERARWVLSEREEIRIWERPRIEISERAIALIAERKRGKSGVSERELLGRRKWREEEKFYEVKRRGGFFIETEGSERKGAKSLVMSECHGKHPLPQINRSLHDNKQ
jgi:hypothetical protein